MKIEQRFLNDLYLIKTSHSKSVNKLTVQIEINREHPIFTGHFPGNPILPGAATLQILKEIISEHLGKKVCISKAANIKYLSFINPAINHVIDFDIDLKETDPGVLSCNATVHYENTVYCSFKGEFKTEEY